MSRKIGRKVGKLGTRMARDGAHAATTLAARLPRLMTAQPTFDDHVERSRMVAEKVDAFAQGAVAAGLAISGFWLKAMTGRVRGPADVMVGILDVAAAATAPASRKVAANARRYGRR
ncbi:MAG: hypothetical protein JNK46_01645 [Methylobacteriaceae bacterium]|nr:hypothetical protein [Methylobacteriaceae bacterium]